MESTGRRMDWYTVLLALVWAEGDITVTLSNPLRADGHSLQRGRWVADILGLLLTATHTCRRTLTHICGLLVSRGVTSVPVSVCSHASPEVVMVLSLHCWRRAYDEDPMVPLVCVWPPSLFLFPVCSGDLTDAVCHILSGQSCFCSSGTGSTPSSQTIKSRIVLRFESRCFSNHLCVEKNKKTVLVSHVKPFKSSRRAKKLGQSLKNQKCN